MESAGLLMPAGLMFSPGIGLRYECNLHIKPEKHDVAVLHHVLLAFRTE